MARTSSSIAPSGITTIPKLLREQLGLAQGGRLRWELQSDGALLVVVVSRYGAIRQKIDAVERPQP